MIRALFKTLLLAIILMNGLMSGEARAHDLEPRSYINLPIDQNHIAIAYGYSEGGVSVTPSIPLKDASIRIDASTLVYIRTLDIAGNSARFDLSFPYVCVSGNALVNGKRLSRNVCGQGDMRARLIYNFYGAPALKIEDFVRQKKDVVVGASLQVSAPTGLYDMNKLLNIGANRWFIKPEIGASFPWHAVSVQVAAGVSIYSDNNAYIGGVTLQQDPLYNLQAHFTYDLSPGQWVAFSGNYYFGGSTHKSGVNLPDRQANSRVGATYSLALDRKNILKFSASKGVITRVGNDSNNLGLAWFHRW